MLVTTSKRTFYAYLSKVIERGIYMLRSFDSVKTPVIKDNVKECLFNLLQRLVEKHSYLYNKDSLYGTKIGINNNRMVLLYNARSLDNIDYFNISMSFIPNHNSKSFIDVRVDTSMTTKNEAGHLERVEYDKAFFDLNGIGVDQALDYVIQLLQSIGVQLDKGRDTSVDFNAILSGIRETVLNTYNAVELNAFYHSLNRTDYDYIDLTENMKDATCITVYGGLGDASNISDLVSKEFGIEVLTHNGQLYISQGKSCVTDKDYLLKFKPLVVPIERDLVHELIKREYTHSKALSYGEKTGDIAVTPLVLRNIDLSLIGVEDTQVSIKLEKQDLFSLRMKGEYSPRELEHTIHVSQYVDGKNILSLLQLNNTSDVLLGEKRLSYHYMKSSKNTTRQLLTSLVRDVENGAKCVEKLVETTTIAKSVMDIIVKKAHVLFPHRVKKLSLTVVTKKKEDGMYMPSNLADYISKGHYVTTLRLETMIEGHMNTFVLSYDASVKEDIHFHLSGVGYTGHIEGQVLMAERYRDLKEYVEDSLLQHLLPHSLRYS